jgi:hypothetical protein
VQAINAAQVEYAQKKAANVRRLHRTSLPIPHAGGTYPPKPLIPILGGILTFESDWSPPFGQSFSNALSADTGEGRLDLGCIAGHGYFSRNPQTGAYENFPGGKPATAFLFKLIAQLQFSGTVPMIDVQAYAEWLSHYSFRLRASACLRSIRATPFLPARRSHLTARGLL